MSSQQIIRLAFISTSGNSGTTTAAKYIRDCIGDRGSKVFTVAGAAPLFVVDVFLEMEPDASLICDSDITIDAQELHNRGFHLIAVDRQGTYPTVPLHADFVIDNNGDLRELYSQIHMLLKMLYGWW